ARILTCRGCRRAVTRSRNGIDRSGMASRSLLDSTVLLLCGLHAGDAGGVAQWHVGCSVKASVVSGLFLFGISFLLAAHRLNGGRSRGPESSYVPRCSEQYSSCPTRSGSAMRSAMVWERT